MKVTGIITEYNPFHNGHKYHIEQARSVTGADYIIAIMSPDFVQRGVPAIFDKHTRTRMALASGADIVIELPLSYASSSAESFAFGSLKLLDGLGVVDYCCFGSEYGNTDALSAIATVLSEEPESYREMLKSLLKQGFSYPSARKQALCQGEHSDWELILDAPNNILGIEYCKAIQSLGSSIKPVAIKRVENNYHDTTLSQSISSATALRNTLFGSNQRDLIANQMPLAAHTILTDSWNVHGPLCEDDFSLLLKYKLMSETPESLATYLDVSKSLGNRICNCLNEFQSFSQFANLLKSRDLTRTRINRALLHILLNVRQTEPITYARILGFNRNAKPLLGAIKDATMLPLISKINPTCYDTFAANLYESVICSRYNRPFVHECSKPVIIYK